MIGIVDGAPASLHNTEIVFLHIVFNITCYNRPGLPSIFPATSTSSTRNKTSFELLSCRSRMEEQGRRLGPGMQCKKET